jgi:uncharacterized membrane protein
LIAAVPFRAIRAHRIATASLIALICLCLAWELRLAPLRPGGSWLVLKTLPLLAALPGILRARRYTSQWASLLILLYVMEGIVRGMTDSGLSSILAMAEAALASVFFAATVVFTRLTRPAPPAEE